MTLNYIDKLIWITAVEPQSERVYIDTLIDTIWPLECQILRKGMYVCVLDDNKNLIDLMSRDMIY